MVLAGRTNCLRHISKAAKRAKQYGTAVSFNPAANPDRKAAAYMPRTEDFPRIKRTTNHKAHIFKIASGISFVVIPIWDTTPAAVTPIAAANGACAKDAQDVEK